jgi:hypothetical protein
MVYIRTKSNIRSCNPSLVVTIKREDKYTFRASTILFYILKNALTTCAHSSVSRYVAFKDCLLSGASFTSV